MNKLTIPAILVATVMVAGAFAFMPVEQATTVHTTITAATAKVVLVTSGDCIPTDATGTNCDLLDVTIPVGTNGMLLSTLVTYVVGADTTADAVNFALLEINGATTTVDPSSALTSSDAVEAVSGDNWGIEGAGADTITSALTIAGLDASAEELIRIDLFILVSGTSTGISATLNG